MYKNKDQVFSLDFKTSMDLCEVLHERYMTLYSQNLLLCRLIVTNLSI